MKTNNCKSAVSDVTELLCCDWTGEDAAAGGDRVIHDRDVDWLRQSDGEYWLLIGPWAVSAGVWPLTFSVFSHRGRGDAAVSGRRLRTRPGRRHEEGHLLFVQTLVGTPWGHFLSPPFLFLPSCFFCDAFKLTYWSFISESIVSTWKRMGSQSPSQSDQLNIFTFKIKCSLAANIYIIPNTFYLKTKCI